MVKGCIVGQAREFNVLDFNHSANFTIVTTHVCAFLKPVWEKVEHSAEAC